MAFKRAERVGPLIFEEISRLLIAKMEDPRLKGVAFTRVKMSKDLRIAHVYFSAPEDDEKIEAAASALDRAKGVFKRAIGANLELRYLPELDFHYDKNIAYADHIDRLLVEMREGRPAPGPGPDDESGG